jgi:hypothetical protein
MRVLPTADAVVRVNVSMPNCGVKRQCFRVYLGL